MHSAETFSRFQENEHSNLNIGMRLWPRADRRGTRVRGQTRAAIYGARVDKVCESEIGGDGRENVVELMSRGF